MSASATTNQQLKRFIRALYDPLDWRPRLARALGIHRRHAEKIYYGERPLTIRQRAILKAVRERKLREATYDALFKTRFLLAFLEAHRRQLESLPLD